MIGNILMIIAIIIISIFIFLMFFSTKDKNENYVQFILVLFPFLGIDLFPSIVSVTIFDFITLVFFLIFYRKKEYNYQTKITYVILLIILAIITILGIVFSENFTRETTSALLQLISIFIFAKILTDEIINNPKFLYKIINCIKITVVFSLFFLIAQFVFGPSFSIAKSQNININGMAGIRYPSFFQDPQKYAQFLSASCFLMFIKKEKEEKISTVNTIIFIFSIAALMFTGGRAAFGGWIFGFIILIAVGNKKYRYNIIIASLIIIPSITIFAEQIPMFKRASVSDSFDFRYLIWQDAYKIFLKNPILGIGIGNYANYVSIHNPDQFWIANNEITIYDHPESGYLKLLTEFGAIGFMTIMTFIIYPIINGIKKFKKSGDIISIIFIASIATWLIGFYTVYSFGDVRIKILVVSLICMLISTNNTIKEKNIEHK